MVTARLQGLLLAAVLGTAVPVAIAPVAAAQKEKEDGPKEQALKLNDLSSIKEMEEKLTELNKDKPGTKKLVQAAVEVEKAAKDGEKPFNFNAALVLAKAAQNVKAYDAAEQFYGIAIRAA